MALSKKLHTMAVLSNAISSRASSKTKVCLMLGSRGRWVLGYSTVRTLSTVTLSAFMLGSQNTQKSKPTHRYEITNGCSGGHNNFCISDYSQQKLQIANRPWPNPLSSRQLKGMAYLTLVTGDMGQTDLFASMNHGHASAYICICIYTCIYVTPA